MTSLKQHPVAWSFYLLYIFGWLYMGYMAYIDFYNYADGRAIGLQIFKFTVFGFIPYLAITFVVAEFSEADTRPFYRMLVRLILVSVPVVLIAGSVLDYFTVRYW